MFFNRQKNIGSLMTILKTRRQRNKKQRINEVNEDIEIEDENVNNISTADEYTEHEAKTDLEFLKSVVVNDNTLSIFKEKLTLTLSYRINLVKDNETDLLVNFPYFFTYPELVNN